MNRQSMLKLLALLLICTAALVASAGNAHFAGNTTWTLNSLIVEGNVNGLVGVPQATVRFIGYGYCFTSSGQYWTPTDPNQMDDDENKADDYPEIRTILSPGTNKANFRMELFDPGTPNQTAGQNCAPGTWVW